MEKKEIVFSELKSHLLAPGNIFWKKISGQEVLISKKGDLCNLNLIEKIQLSKQKVLIEDEVDRTMLLHAKELFHAYEEEILMKKKIEYKNKIFQFLEENFIKNEKTQFEFNLIFWMTFSNVEFSDGAKFVEKDRDCFIRSLTIASNLTFMAMLLGYYEMNFLKNLFSKTINDYFYLLDKNSGLTLKDFCELFHENKIEKEEMQKKFELDEKSLLLLQSKKGTQLTNEYSDLERLFIELNESYDFRSLDEKNFLLKLKEKSINMESKFYFPFENCFGDEKVA